MNRAERVGEKFYLGGNFVLAVSKRSNARACTAVFKELGRRVRELRKNAGYIQADMGAYGFSIRHWQQIEAGRPITVMTLMRIGEIFKIRLEDLVRDLGLNKSEAPPTTDLEGPAPADPTVL